MKKLYEPPKIVDERSLEAQAMACNKTPGIGWGNLTPCGQVFCGRVDSHEGCSINTDARSS